MGLNAFDIMENEIKEETKTEIAKNMLENKFNIEDISKVTGLSINN